MCAPAISWLYVNHEFVLNLQDLERKLIKHQVIVASILSWFISWYTIFLCLCLMQGTPEMMPLIIWLLATSFDRLSAESTVKGKQTFVE